MTTIKHGFGNRYGNPLGNPMANPLGVSSRDSMPTTFRVAGWGGSRRQTTAFERWLLVKMLKRLGNPPVTITAWDGKTVTSEKKGSASGDAGKHFRLYLHDSTALRQLAFDPEYQFGELYSSGGLDVDGDLADLIELIYATQKNGPKTCSADCCRISIRRVPIYLVRRRSIFITITILAKRSIGSGWIRK